MLSFLRRSSALLPGVVRTVVSSTRHWAALSVLRTAALAVVVAIAACSGGGGDGDDDELIAAFNVVGQADFETAGANSGGVGSSTLAQPLGNPSVSGDVLFVADTANNRVVGYSPIPDAPGGTATIVLGQTDFSSTSPATSQTGLALPASASAAEGRLVVADSGNNRVLIWDNVPNLSGTPPDVVIGQSGFGGGNSGLDSDRLSFPTAAVIASNRLIVADQNNNRVLIWNSVPTENGQPADVVLGQPDFFTREEGDDAEQMNRPSSVWSDGFRLLVSDTGNNRVLYWQLFPQDTGTEADFVIGQTDFGRSNSASGSSGLNTPYGVSSDGSRVYIADSGNNRVLEYNSLPLSNGADASETFGQEDFTGTSANDDDQDGDTDDDPSDRTLSGPTGAAVFDGVLYVSDRNNNRIMLFPQ